MNEAGLCMRGTAGGRVCAVTEEIHAKTQHFHFVGPVE